MGETSSGSRFRNGESRRRGHQHHPTFMRIMLANTISTIKSIARHEQRVAFVRAQARAWSSSDARSLSEKFGALVFKATTTTNCRVQISSAARTRKSSSVGHRRCQTVRIRSDGGETRKHPRRRRISGIERLEPIFFIEIDLRFLIDQRRPCFAAVGMTGIRGILLRS